MSNAVTIIYTSFFLTKALIISYLKDALKKYAKFNRNIMNKAALFM